MYRRRPVLYIYLIQLSLCWWWWWCISFSFDTIFLLFWSRTASCQPESTKDRSLYISHSSCSHCLIRSINPIHLFLLQQQLSFFFVCIALHLHPILFTPLVLRLSLFWNSLYTCLHANSINYRKRTCAFHPQKVQKTFHQSKKSIWIYWNLNPLICR